jgi:putative DNA primase/helicase
LSDLPELARGGSGNSQSRTSFLDAALGYAARGWPVFPLRRKIPLIAKADDGHGHHDATTDTAVISDWWTQYPNANIGIAGIEQSFFAFDIGISAHTRRALAKPPQLPRCPLVENG